MPGLVVSPYTKRKFVDSTLYATSAFLRTMELLLGLPPMTQYNASAMPLYNSFGTKTDLTPYQVVAPKIEVNEKNTQLAWGAKESMEMNLDDVDQAPMFALNEILWKSAKGPGCADALASSPVLVPKAVGLSSGVRLRYAERTMDAALYRGVHAGRLRSLGMSSLHFERSGVRFGPAGSLARSRWQGLFQRHAFGEAFGDVFQ